MKVVINRCHGGFDLSDEAVEWLINEKGWTLTEYTDEGEPINPEADFIATGGYFFVQWRSKEKELRTNLDLIKCIETLGEKVNGPPADLKVVEVPDDAEWEIREDYGLEVVEEVHRTWGDDND